MGWRASPSRVPDQGTRQQDEPRSDRHVSYQRESRRAVVYEENVESGLWSDVGIPDDRTRYHTGYHQRSTPTDDPTLFTYPRTYAVHRDRQADGRAWANEEDHDTRRRSQSQPGDMSVLPCRQPPAARRVEDFTPLRDPRGATADCEHPANSNTFSYGDADFGRRQPQTQPADLSVVPYRNSDAARGAEEYAHVLDPRTDPVRRDRQADGRAWAYEEDHDTRRRSQSQPGDMSVLPCRQPPAARRVEYVIPPRDPRGGAAASEHSANGRGFSVKDDALGSRRTLPQAPGVLALPLQQPAAFVSDHQVDSRAWNNEQEKDGSRRRVQLQEGGVSVLSYEGPGDAEVSHQPSHTRGKQKSDGPGLGDLLCATADHDCQPEHHAGPFEDDDFQRRKVRAHTADPSVLPFERSVIAARARQPRVARGRLQVSFNEIVKVPTTRTASRRASCDSELRDPRRAAVRETGGSGSHSYNLRERDGTTEHERSGTQDVKDARGDEVEGCSGAFAGRLSLSRKRPAHTNRIPSPSHSQSSQCQEEAVDDVTSDVSDDRDSLSRWLDGDDDQSGSSGTECTTRKALSRNTRGRFTSGESKSKGTEHPTDAPQPKSFLSMGNLQSQGGKQTAAKDSKEVNQVALDQEARGSQDPTSPVRCLPRDEEVITISSASSEEEDADGAVEADGGLPAHEEGHEANEEMEIEADDEVVADVETQDYTCHFCEEAIDDALAPPASLQICTHPFLNSHYECLMKCVQETRRCPMCSKKATVDDVK